MLTDWQTTVVSETIADIEKADSIESLEKVALDVALSSQDWFKKMCWPEVKKKRDEVEPPLDRPPVMLVVDVMNWVRGDFSVQQNADETVQSFMKRLRFLNGKINPKWILLASDSRDELIRKEICPQYKESRDERPNEVTEIAVKIKASCEHMQIPFIATQGYEADDIAATMATRCICRGFKAVLCTSDKDYYQLVCRDVVVWHKNTYINVEAVVEKFGLYPRQIVDYLCLCGKDDVPGAFGIGHTTASKLLAKHGDFLGIYDHKHQLTPKIKEGIELFAPKYWVARQCHTLERKLKIDFDWNFTHCLA